MKMQSRAPVDGSRLILKKCRLSNWIFFGFHVPKIGITTAAHQLLCVRLTWFSLPFSLQQGHRPVTDLFQALRKHLSHRPALLQAGDQGGMRPVHRRDVGQRAVRADRREAAAEDQLGGGGRKRRDTSVHTGAADGHALADGRRRFEDSVCSSCKRCTAEPECKKRNCALSRQYCKKEKSFCCYLHQLFISSY